MPIYFIRHGQSEFNAAFEGGADPMIFDAPLSPLGFTQAKEARKTVAELGISRVVTSPFTRAIQTARTVFDGVAPIEVQLGHHELLSHSCDIGRHPGKLSSEFPDLSFDHLPHFWWHENVEASFESGQEIEKEPTHLFQERISRFVKDLQNNGDETIAFVGHGNAFKEIIGFMLNNCQIHRFL